MQLRKKLVMLLALSLAFSSSMTVYASEAESSLQNYSENTELKKQAEDEESSPEETTPEEASEETEPVQQETSEEEPITEEEPETIRETETQPVETMVEETDSEETTQQETEEESTPEESTEEESTEPEDYSDRVNDPSDEGAMDQRIRVVLVNVEVPNVVEANGRFVTVDKDPAYAQAKAYILEEMNDKAAKIGRLSAGSKVYILEEVKLEDGTDSEWYYVESGEARGFIRRTDVTRSADLTKKQRTAYKKKAKLAKVLRPAAKNSAYTWSMKTTESVVVDKVVAVTKNKAFLHSKTKKSSKKVGTLKKGAICYVLEQVNEDWLYVESGDARGYLRIVNVRMGETVTEEVLAKGEATYPVGKADVPAAKNAAYYHTKTSVVPGIQEGEIGESILENLNDYAKSESLPGYVFDGKISMESIVENFYAAYGYETGDTLREIQNAGETQSVEEIQPGDLVIYRTEVKSEKKTKAEKTVKSEKKTKAEKTVKSEKKTKAEKTVKSEKKTKAEKTVKSEKKTKSAKDVKSEKTASAKITSAAAEYETRIGIYVEKNKVLVESKDQTKLKTKKIGKLDVTSVVRIAELTQTQVAGAGVGEVNATADMYGQNLGVFKLTFYCPCASCNGPWENAITSTGRTAEEGRTIAVDPKVIPYGTKVIIGGHVFIAEDCGGAIKGNRIDVYVENHQVCNALGVQYANVFLCK